MATKDLITTYRGSIFDVTAGRTTTIDMGGTATKVLSDATAGHATVNPDGTVALVLPDASTRDKVSFTVEVDGRPLTVDVRAVGGAQGSEWGAGDHYMLQTDAGGSVVVEPGENHRKVYVTAGKHGLTAAEIAGREGVSAGRIDGDWLVEHPEYGGSQGMALDSGAGRMLWRHLTDGDANDDLAPSSHWLLIEKGHTYAELGRLISRAGEGESSLHPLYVGTWGTGGRPVVESELRSYQEVSKNFVVQGIEFTGGTAILLGENLLLDDLVLREQGFNVHNIERFTLRDSQVLDVAKETPNTAKWNGADSKISGAFIRNSDGILLEETLFDHNGWEDDYRYDRSTAGGQPPSKFSHNLYIQKDNYDVTLRDSAIIDGAAYGAQMRSGGVVEDTLFTGNNLALLLGKDAVDTNNFSLALGNLVSIAGYKEVDSQQGALAFGILNKAPKSTLLDNIVAHLTDPSDAAGRRERDVTQPDTPLNNGFPAYADDTIAYNWLTERKRYKQGDIDRNVPDIPASKLDGVTIRNFVEDVLGRNGGADGREALSAWLRASWDKLDGPSDVVEYFQKGFGTWNATRNGSETLRFVPDSRGDGMRWDNKLNWSTEDLPGTVKGDAVDLAGNWVTHGGTTTLAGLDLGAGGVLTVAQGYLDVGTGLAAGEGARIVTDLAGQFWTRGYDGNATIEISVDGGRFANTGLFAGPADITVSGEAEMLLATGGARFELSGLLDINGSEAKVGFDGQGGDAVLQLEAGATLSFRPDAGGVSAIGEFRSGAWDTRAPNVGSTIDLGAGDTTLALALGGLGLKNGVSHTLAAADEISGGFDDIDILGVSASGIDLVLDYAADTLRLVGGSGKAPGLQMVGSSAAENFHLVKGFENAITDYESKDKVDVTDVAGQGGTLTATATGSTTTVLRLGGETAATISHAAGLKAVSVATADGSVTLPRGGAVDVEAARDPQTPPTSDGESASGGGGGDSGSGGGSGPGGSGNGAPPVAAATVNAAPTFAAAFGPETVDVNSWNRFVLEDYFDDPDGDALTYMLDGAPGFVFDNGRGRLVVGPKDGDGGTYRFGITASDGTSESQRLEAEVQVRGDGAALPPASGSSGSGGSGSGNAAPRVDAGFGRETVPVGSREWFELDQFFFDSDGDELDYALTSAPDFAWINSSDKLVVAPDADDVGGHAFWVTASDGELDAGRALTVLISVDDIA